MATDLVGLSEVLPPDLEGIPPAPFQACARYYEPMDFVLYLREDLPYRADRVDSFLTLLWHPSEDRAIGIKLKGFRYLFQRLQAIFRAQGVTITDNEFLPLVSAVEVATVAGLGASMTVGEERKRLTKSYATAKTLVKSARFDQRELRRAA
jgi:hypothetical protein